MAIVMRSHSQTSYPVLGAGAVAARLTVRESRPAAAPQPRLLDRVREAIRARQYWFQHRSPASRALLQAG